MTETSSSPSSKQTRTDKAIDKSDSFMTYLTHKSLVPTLIVLIFLYVIILVFCGYVLFRNEEVPITVINICFAVQLGIASVCFSWYRTFSDQKIKLLNSIRRIGESSFLSAVLFLLAAMIKYAPILAKTVIKVRGNQLFHYGALVANIAANIFFIIAIFKFMHTLLSLFQVLRLRQSDTFHSGLCEKDYKV